MCMVQNGKRERLYRWIVIAVKTEIRKRKGKQKSNVWNERLDEHENEVHLFKMQFARRPPPHEADEQTV